MASTPANGKGITLIELMVTIAVLAILATIAVPAFQNTIKNNRISSQANELNALITYARSEALRRSANVSVVISGQSSTGWSASVVDDEATQNGASGCGPGVLRCAEFTNVRLETSADSNDPNEIELVFNSRGYLAGGPTDEQCFILEHKGCAGDRQKREVEVLGTGQFTMRTLECADDGCLTPTPSNGD